ncbi:MAG: hypothetical protein KC503_33575 [Myxococcales bacterium]|nr:hypothetical protein [Myxococcales bacterium]
MADAENKSAGIAESKSAGIRDLGYARYDGPRLPPRRRYAVLAKQHLALFWRGGLVKAVLIVGMLPLLICAVVMYFKLQAAKALAASSFKYNLGSPPEQWIYNCVYWCQLWFGFAMSMLVAAPAISDDVRTGAFHFYFARPVSKSHYAVGKLIAISTLIAVLAAGPGFLLGVMRLSLASGSDDALKSLPILLAVLMYALLFAGTLTLPALALSSLTSKTGHVMGGWAALFFLPWPLGEATASTADMPYVALISLPTDLRLVAQWLFGVTPSYDVPVAAPLGVLLAVCFGSALVLRARLEKVEVFA